MYNVLLDPLPQKWNGYRIDPAFQNGIQIMQLIEDGEISEREKVWLAASLLFLDPPGIHAGSLGRDCLVYGRLEYR